MLRHTLKRGANLNLHNSVSRSMKTCMTSTLSNIGIAGLKSGKLIPSNILVSRNRILRYNAFDIRSLSASTSPALKEDEKEKEKSKKIEETIVLSSSSPQGKSEKPGLKGPTETQIKKPDFLNIADIRSKESYSTSLARLLADLPSVILQGTKAFTLWTIQFSKEVAANPREKFKEIGHIIKEGAQHYWVGSKLLIADVKIATGILARATTGSKLTRREQKQLVRTASDLARLVPMSVFVLIPFMELLLPVALKLFPNMLPSTFEDSLKKEDAMKRELQMRLAMAGFMKDMLREMAKDVAKKNDPTAASAAEVTSFVDKAKLGSMKNEDIFKFAKLFKDDLTLDNMSRTQLVTLCTFMNLPIYGADAFIRFKLRSHIRDIQNDDQRILFEGIDSLNRSELQEACRERGMRALGLSKEQLIKQLQQWIDLSCNQKVPISLLILSRSFVLTQGEEALEKAIGQSISALDEDIVTAVVLEAATPEERKSKEIRTLKLEAYEHQADLIAGEKEDREKDEKLAAEKLAKEKKEEEDEVELLKKKTLQEDEQKELAKEGQVKGNEEDTDLNVTIKQDITMEQQVEGDMKDTVSSIMGTDSHTSTTKTTSAATSTSTKNKDNNEDDDDLKMYLDTVKMIREKYPDTETEAMKKKEEEGEAEESTTPPQSPPAEASKLKSLGLTPAEIAALDVFVSVSAVDREKVYVERIRRAVAEVVKSMKKEEEADAAAKEQIEFEQKQSEQESNESKEMLKMAQEHDVQDTQKDTQKDISDSSSSFETKKDIEAKEVKIKEEILSPSSSMKEKQEETISETVDLDPYGTQEESPVAGLTSPETSVATDSSPKVEVPLQEGEEVITGATDAQTDKTSEQILETEAIPQVEVEPQVEEEEVEEYDAVSSKISSFLTKTLEKLDDDIAKVDEYIGEKLHVLDLDQDGLLSESELTLVLQTMFKHKLTEDEAKAKVRKLMDTVDVDFDGVISVEELRNWLRKESQKKDVEVHESSLAKDED